MLIEYSKGLLLASITITYLGEVKTIQRMAIDTGASHTIVLADAVYDVGIVFQNGDRINRSFGIGGTDYAFEKTVDRIDFGGFQMNHQQIDFGQIDWDINGL